MAAVTPAPRRPTPAKPQRSTTPAPPRQRSANAGVNERVEQDLDDIFAELNFGTGECKVKLSRMEPMTDPLTGQHIAGHLETYSRPITPDEVKNRYGGGRFQVLIMGPKPGGGGSAIRGRKVLEIAGDPKALPSRDAHNDGKREEKSLAEMLMERAEREREREDRKLEQMRAEIQESNKTILALVAKMGERPKDDSNAGMLQVMREENKRREEELKAEMKRREDADNRDREERERRWQDEREERRRADAEAQRRHEAALESQKQQMQLQMKQLELQQQQTAERMKAEAQSQKEMTTMMLSFMQKNDSDKEARAQSAMQMQLDAQRAMSENATKFQEMQMKFLLEQTKGKDDFFTVLEKFQLFKDMMNPPEAEVPAWERGIDKATEALQGLIPGFAMLRAGGGGGGAKSAATPVQQPQRRLAPGSVAVVEDFEEEETEEPAALSAPAATAASATEPTASPEVVEEEAGAEPSPDANPATDFHDYSDVDGSDNEGVFLRLVQNLDLAMQRELSLDETIEKCVQKLPAEQLNVLKMAPADLIVDYIEQYVPADWRLRGLDAEDFIRELIAKVKAS